MAKEDIKDLLRFLLPFSGKYKRNSFKFKGMAMGTLPRKQ